MGVVLFWVMGYSVGADEVGCGLTVGLAAAVVATSDFW